MNTKSRSEVAGSIGVATAVVTGARHQRMGRNGQDGAARWQGVDAAGNEAAVVVVTDGCGSGASSEVGARLGATLFARALGARVAAGGEIGRASTWDAVRADVLAAIAELLERMPGDRVELIREQFLFTIVAAATNGREAAVWALGDGAYAFGGRAWCGETRVLGPFADNQPPYLAYDLTSGAPGEPAHFAVVDAGVSSIVIATDGACDLESGLERFASDRYVDHPDALRRQLSVLARGEERIDWDEQRVVRTPAVLQDDCAIGMLRWTARARRADSDPGDEDGGLS